MNSIHNLLAEPRTGKTNLGKALNERDDNKAFARCMVGGEGCKQLAINAHCVPQTALELIMDESREVIAGHSEPPKTPMHWLNQDPLRPMTIERLNAGRWACRPHDDIFGTLDTKNLRAFTERDKFLIIYKITVYLTQRMLHAAERIATPVIDPAAETPQGLSQETEGYLTDVAQEMTHSAVRITTIKWQMDKMLNNEQYDRIEYRATMWPTTPTMAAVGMARVPGPGNRVDWYGENSYVPVWLALLPQEHGQTIITASPKGAEEYARDIHEGMPQNQVDLVPRGNNWTRLTCHKVLTNATDIAISKERFLQIPEYEQRQLQKFIFLRGLQRSRRRKSDFPNLLNVR